MPLQSKPKPLRASPPDMPTPEHLARNDAWRSEYLSAKPGSPVRLRNLDSTAIDRLLFNGWISADSHTVLSRFQRELKDAGMIFSTRSSMEPSGTSGVGGFVADRAFSRAKKISTQQKALAEKLTRQEHEVVIDCLISDLALNKRGSELMTRAAIVLQEVYDAPR